jgi:hypothetical protein
VSTIVYQSYRTSAVPLWIARSLATVRRWAESRGHAYTLIDDALFERVPPWFRDKVAGDKVIMSDLARLVCAKELLQQHDRAIWVDADVVVFDPDGLTLAVEAPFAFCREAWLSRSAEGQLSCSTRVNNMVAVFARQSPILDFYIHACETIVREATGPVARLDIGTRFLTVLQHACPLPLLSEVALLSPVLLDAIARGEERLVKLYMERLGVPVRAANLCASFRGQRVDGVTVDDRLFATVVDRLVSSRGEALNRFAPRAP